MLQYQRGLSRDFTLVMWNQCGSGKSFTKASLKQPAHRTDYVADAQPLVQYLCRKFQKEQIILAAMRGGTSTPARLPPPLPPFWLCPALGKPFLPSATCGKLFPTA